MFTLAVACFSIYAKGKIDSDQLAFALQIITDVIVFFSYSLIYSAELQSNMSSSQRVHQYTKLESEDLLVKDEIDQKLKSQKWPSEGVLEFNEVTMRYRETLEPSISNLSFKV